LASDRRQRRGSLEEALDRLSAIRDATSGESRQLLKESLDSRFGAAVAKAAGIIGAGMLDGFESALIGAFERLLKGGGQADPSCAGKVAIVAALLKLNAAAQDVFLAAARCVQIEPAPEGLIDTAAELRAAGIVALAESGYTGMLELAVPMLVDEEVRARLGAARALVVEGSRAALLLLRLKALSRDAPEVIEECLRGILDREPSSLEFVAGFLKGKGMGDVAALALASTRRPEAVPYLEAALDDSDARPSMILLALAMLRTEESIELVLSQIAGPDLVRGMEALDALEIYRGDEELQRRIQQAIDKSKHARALRGPRRY
jgi:hypothetical protein